ncbi:MAG TPA: VOC family protein [Candidatus Acidoferrales bacterium]|nr:VOC family protein [Candidatus Acidoferrales bacterium]
MIQKATALLRVERVEPSLPFWVDRLGFQKVTEVMEGNSLGFVILSKGHVEIMLQSRASLAKDLPMLSVGAMTPAVVYMGVTNLEEISSKLAPSEILVAKRTTYYGMEEIWAREPGGHVIGFAAPGSEPTT